MSGINGRSLAVDLHAVLTMSKMNKLALAAVVTTALAVAPIAHADGNSANLDQIVGKLYTQVQHGCTPTEPPRFQRIVWDNGGPGGQGGSGRIIDADPALGGPFQVLWNLGPDTSGLPGYRAVPAQPQGYWDINLEFC